MRLDAISTAICETQKLTQRKSQATDRALRYIAWFWLFVVLVLSIAVLVLVIDCLIRLASNAIFKALENIRRRDIYRFGLGDAFRVRVPLR